MDLRSVSLKRRVLIGFIASSALLATITVVIGVQYLISYSSEVRIQQRLTPATELADELLIAQSSASGHLVEYVLTGRERALTAYGASSERADLILVELEMTLADEPSLVQRIGSTRVAQETWGEMAVAPTIELMRAGDVEAATRAVSRPRAERAFDNMITVTKELQDEIESQRNEVRNELARFTRQLGVWFLFLTVGLLAVVGGAFLALNRWILQPLLVIRSDVARATDQSHTHPIAPAGPPELQALAQDAEALRRSLVAEIDDASAARTGLAQDAPLVAAMQAALAPPPIPPQSGLSIAGTSQSAEGVLAGDWWDVFRTADGAVAVIIGDTSGHGTTSAITALRTRDLLHGSLRSGATPQASTEIVAATFQEDGNFVTVVVALVDSISHTITYVNAGHQPPVLVRRDKEFQLLRGTGPLLSSLGGTWTQQTISFDPGDVLMAFTDGLLEENRSDGGDLSPEDIARIIRGMDAPVRRDANEVLTRVIAQVRSGSTRWQRDDMTAVTVGHSGMAL